MSKTLNSNSRWGSGGGGLTFPVAGEKNWDVWIETLVQALLDHDHSSNEKGREVPGGALTDATVTADKLLLNNNTYIRWKDDQAATKDIIGVDTSNNLTLGNVTMGASSDEGSKLVLGSGHQGSLELQKATLADGQSATSVPGFAVLASDEAAFVYYSITRSYNDTFVDGDVTVGTDNIASTAHGLEDLERVRVSNSGGALPTGLAIDTDYYVILVDANNFKLASSRANAVADTAVDITAASGGGTHTVESAHCQMGTLMIDQDNVAIIEEYSGDDTGVTFTNNNGQLEYATTSTGQTAALRYMVVRG